MTSINLLAIIMILFGAGSAHLAGSLLWPTLPSRTYLLIGLSILLLDVAWRASRRVTSPKEKWFGNSQGGAISIFPLWSIGLFGIVFEALRQLGYHL